MNSEPIKAPDQVLDTRGTMCPEPIRLAEVAARDLDNGALMEVLATDLAAPIDFEAWCLGRGHRYLCAQKQDDWLTIRVEIRKNQDQS